MATSFVGSVAAGVSRPQSHAPGKPTHITTHTTINITTHTTTIPTTIPTTRLSRFANASRAVRNYNLFKEICPQIPIRLDGRALGFVGIRLILLVTCTPVRGDDWKPAPSPLMTRWATDVSPDKVHPEYPRPQMVRERWQNLNGLWQYAEAKAGEAPPIGKQFDGRILAPFPVESALSGVGKRMDRLWYRRTFTVPKDQAGQRVLRHSGAVDWEAKVWVNGEEVGEHRGGYDSFSFDITDPLTKEGEQELFVGVYDPSDAGNQPRGKQVRKPEGIWYTPSTGTPSLSRADYSTIPSARREKPFELAAQ